MADERKGELDLDTEEGSDLGLRAEMAASEFVLRHWVKGAVAVAVVIVGLVAYGQWHNMYVDAQRDTTASINDVMGDLPDDMIGLAQRRMGLPGSEPLDLPPVEAAAAKLAGIAQGATGAAAVEAWLKSAELFRIVGNTAQRRASLEGAAAASSGVLHYSAGAALANLDLEEGNTDGGLARFRALTTDADVFLARTATLDLASALEALGRNKDAVAEYDAFLTKWPDAPNKDAVQKSRDKAAAAPEVTAPVVVPTVPVAPEEPAAEAAVEPAPDAPEEAGTPE